MNNLTQTQTDAKQEYLNRQQESMLACYRQSEPIERKAIIRHINSFLEVIPKANKSFWVNFLIELEKID